MDFDSRWKEEMKDYGKNEEAAEEQEVPSEYLLRDGLAKYKLLADLLGKYFHAKHGEPLKKITPPHEEELAENLAEFKFHL